MQSSPNYRILVLDDDPAFRERVRLAFDGCVDVVEAGSEDEFRALWIPRTFDLLLLDMRLRLDREGLDVLREVFAQDEHQPVIMVSAYGDTESAIEAVGAGAMMFLHKQEFSPALLGRMVEAVIEQGRLRRQVQGLRELAWADEPDSLLGNSGGIRDATVRLREMARDRYRLPVILGERGCGASLAARLLHRQGPAPDGPFVETESETLARDSAIHARTLSPWVQAAGGTLAIRGIETIGTEDGKLLREMWSTKCGDMRAPRLVLMQHLETPAGGRGKVRPGELPNWLGQCEQAFLVRLPALRERREDIPLLATHFLQRQRARGHTKAHSIGGAAMARLEGFSWPGNVQELRSTVEYAALQAVATGADEVGIQHLPASLGATGTPWNASQSVPEAWSYRLHLARTELALADRAIRELGVAQKVALSKALGYTDRFTLARRIRKALADFPQLTADYPAAARLFQTRRKT
jgi:two-component system nitrogen regulation response regulator NtrX